MTPSAAGTEHLATKLTTDSLVEMLRSEMKTESAQFDTLDSKAGLVLGFGLVSVTELVGFLLLAASDAHPSRAAVPTVAQLLFYFGTAFLMSGTVFAMMALYPRGFVRDAGIITAQMLTKAPQVSDVLRSVLAAQKKNGPVLKSKGTLTRLGAVFVLAGLLCFAAFVVVLFHSVIAQHVTP